MLETSHGDITASSYSAKSMILLTQHGLMVRVDPDVLRAIVEAHDPSGFNDD